MFTLLFVLLDFSFFLSILLLFLLNFSQLSQFFFLNFSFQPFLLLFFSPFFLFSQSIFLLHLSLFLLSFLPGHLLLFTFFFFVLWSIPDFFQLAEIDFSELFKNFVTRLLVENIFSYKIAVH